MRSSFLTFAALLLALPTSGCLGKLSLYDDVAPDRWPIVPTSTELASEAHCGPPAQRPTLLVRYGARDPERTALRDLLRFSLRALDDDVDPAAWVAEEARTKLGLAQPTSVAEQSGLFAAVFEQPLDEEPTVDADYTLELMLDRDVEMPWYSLLGLVPGVPFVDHNAFTLHARVLDASRTVLDERAVRARQTEAFWVPLLPLNLIMLALPGVDLGLDPFEGRWNQLELVNGMIRQVLVQSHERIDFQKAREPQAAPPEADGAGSPPSR